MKSVFAFLLSFVSFAVSAAVVQVDSVKSPNTLWYDLGYKLSSDMSVELVVSFDEAGSELCGIFGARSAAAKQNVSLNLTEDGDLCADFGNDGTDYASYRATMRISPKTVYTATLTSSGTEIVGGGTTVRAAKGWSGATFTTPGNAFLFAINGTTWAKPTVRFYGCTVKNGSGAVIHRYVPALEDGAPCVYDVSAQQVLTPSGSGSLSYDGEPFDVRLPYVKMTPGLTIGCGLDSVSGLTAVRTFRTLDEDGVGALTTETVSLDQMVWTDRQLYSLKIYEGDALVRELVPVAKDGAVRLYDRVWRRFATVTGGKLATDCGAPYDKTVEYANTWGDCVYDLGYPLSSDMTIIYRLEYIGGGSGTYGLFGAREAAGSRNISINFNIKDGVVTLAADLNNESYASYRASVTMGGKKMYTVTLKKTKVTISDGTTTTSAERAWSGEAFATPSNAQLFSINGATFNDASIRFYGCTVKDARGVVLHDYIPVVKGSVGMIYDTVDGVMLANAKTGSLSSPAQTYLTAEVLKAADGVAEEVVVSDADGKTYPYGVYVVADAEDRGENTTNGWAFVGRVGAVPAHLGAGSWSFAVPKKVIRHYPAFRVVTIPEFDETSYVRDGLIGLWDAKANHAKGHGESQTWKDLIGRADFVNANWDFTADCVHIPKGNEATADLPADRLPLSAVKTAEVVCRADENWKFDNTSSGIMLCVCNDLVLFFRNNQKTQTITPRFTLDDGSSLKGYRYATSDLGVSEATSWHSYSLTYCPGVVGSSFWYDGECKVSVASLTNPKSFQQDTTTHADSVRIGPAETKGDEYASVVRLYDRKLTQDERRYNAKIDAIRYQGVAPWIKSSGAFTTANRPSGLLVIVQ